MPAPHHSPHEVANDLLPENEPVLGQYKLYEPPKKQVSVATNRFSFAWFFLVFWLTAIATLLLSWSMISNM